MKTITLKKMVLDNFAGITATCEMNNGQNVFSGKNGAGKTRIANAEQFVLWGKNLEQNTKSEVKSLINGELQVHGVHSVFAEYDINGENLKIGRLIKVKWTKPRGSVEKVRSGNDIVYFKDGMDKESAESITAKQFSDLILEKFGPDYQKVSILNFVSSMPWKERRDLLTGLAPVDKEQIIDSIDGFKPLLDGKTPEQRKEAAEKRQRDLKKKFDDNLSAITERKKDVESAGNKKIGTIEGEIAAIRAEIKGCQSEIDKAKQGDNSSSLKRIQELNRELSKLQNDFEEKKQAAINVENERKRNITGVNEELKRLYEDLGDHQDKRDKLLLEWNKIKNRTIEGLEICEACGQKIPADVLEKLKQTFMKDRGEALKQNKARGLDVKQEIERIQGLIDGHTARFNDLKKQNQDPIIDQKEPEGSELIKKQIAELQAKECYNPELKRLETELQALNVRLDNSREQKAKVEALDDSKKRIKELEAERKKLTAENDKIQNFLALHDQYIEAYANAVQDPVNEMLKTARFKMFDTSEKGIKTPACVVCNEDWKEYDSMLSTGEKVGVDLDIVRVMQEKFGIKAPVWIDERQSYTGKIELDCQYFELISKVDESKSEGCGDYKPWLKDNDKSCSNCMLLAGCNKHVLAKEV